MKKIVLFPLLAVMLVGCGPKSTSYDTLEKVIVTGKADNLEPGITELKTNVVRLGFEPEQLSVLLDSVGNFRLEFETYAPVEVHFKSNPTLFLLAYPGDSIHIEFDGKTYNPQTLFNSLSITGDRAETNKNIAAFFFLYHIDPVLPLARHEDAIKKDTPDQFLVHLDTLQNRWSTLYDTFKKMYTPNEEAQQWIKGYIETEYINKIAEFNLRFEKNVHNGEREFPQEFKDKTLDLLPLSESMFVNVSAINAYKSFYWNIYVSPRLIQYVAETGLVSQQGMFKGTQAQALSLYSSMLKKTLEYTPDPLLKQLVLIEFLNEYLKNGGAGVVIYEENQALIDKNMTLPCLKEPLKELYLKTKYRVENSIIQSPQF